MNIGQESETVEFKLTTSEIHAAVETIAAMLNKKGHGTIYFGVDDKGTVKGQEITDNTYKTVTDMVLRDLEPKITPSFEVVKFVGENGRQMDVLKLAFSGEQAPYSAFGRFLVRVGTQNRQMSRAELRRLFLDEDYSYPWDRELSDYTIDDVDDSSLREYYKEAVAWGRLSLSSYDKEAVLAAVEGMKNGKLFNGTYAMFGENANIGLNLAVYATDSKITFLDLDIRKGNIYRMQKEAIQYISKNIRWRAEIKEKRTDIPEIPMEAIREAVMNAFAHSMYVPTPEIDINIYPSSVTISNPGTFPENLTPMDYVNKKISSLKRNPLLLDLLFRCHGMEKNGTGFKRIAAACESNGIRWETEGNPYSFAITFYRQPSFRLNKEIYDNLSDGEMAIFRLLLDKNNLSTKDLILGSGQSERSVQRNIASLIDKGLIVREGGRRFGQWVINKDILL